MSVYTCKGLLTELLKKREERQMECVLGQLERHHLLEVQERG